MPNTVERFRKLFGQGIDVAKGYLNQVQAKRAKEREWIDVDNYFMADEKYVRLIC